ncbi:hypothetical protein R0K30_23325, partial [Bacillus sp. SIMBA_154]|uniref:hypothetical protein n=1 Tax=Bacillus sp. SIMBA_154 TaxID=3080859 RepID=UPI00397C0C49
LQNWFLKQELQSVQGVAEIATVGGMVETYQVVVQPEALHRYSLTAHHIFGFTHFYYRATNLIIGLLNALLNLVQGKAIT